MGGGEGIAEEEVVEVVVVVLVVVLGRDAWENATAEEVGPCHSSADKPGF